MIARTIWTRLPEPTGSWPVGTSIASFSTVGGAGVPLVARLWYPAVGHVRGATASYLYGSKGLSLRDRLVGALVRTDAAIDAPIGAGPFPLALYIAGFGGRFHHNTALAQDLASHGYVVLALDDTEPSVGFDYSSIVGARAARVEGDRKVRAQARTVIALIDELRRREGATVGPLAHRLDFDRVGIFGFSFGGAVAAQVAATDRRVRAAVDLDGSVYDTVERTGVGKPFLYVSSESDVDPAEGPLANAFDRENRASVERGLREHGGYLLTVDGTKHYDFTDTPVLPSFRHTGVGTIDGRRCVRIVSKYVVAFFERHLRGKPEPLLDGSQRFDGAATIRAFVPPMGRATLRSIAASTK